MVGDAYRSTGFLMIDTINIRNFRCFKDFRVENCRRFNVVVGDNGAGKTALFEAIFLALSGNVEVSVRLKMQRGLEPSFSGAIKAMEEAIWQDYFYNLNWREPISIRLLGNGPEARSLTIARGTSELTLPFAKSDQVASAVAPIVFTWQDQFDREYTSSPRISKDGLQLGSTGEDLPDFFMFAANQTVGSTENAARFSDLSRMRREQPFVEFFTREFPWIEGLNIEVAGGQPIIHASLRDTPTKLPITLISGGINRIMGIMLAVASRPRSVVIVDEVENGLFHKHKTSLWRGLIEMTRQQDSQLFISTHDEEWLTALVDAAGENIDDVALWRLERKDGGERAIRQIPGRILKAGIEAGGEVR
jgi:predicted ATPase